MPGLAEDRHAACFALFIDPALYPAAARDRVVGELALHVRRYWTQRRRVTVEVDTNGVVKLRGSFGEAVLEALARDDTGLRDRWLAALESAVRAFLEDADRRLVT